MDTATVLEFADELMFTRTGKHLDDLQKSILQGVWQGQKYSEIANDYKCTEGHVKDSASELWKILSNILGENLNRSNIKTALERVRFSIIAKDSANVNHFHHNINICRDTFHPPSIPNPRSHEDGLNQSANATQSKTWHYLTEMPLSASFYGRHQELSTLKQWILQERCRVITIFGMVGIGKTALAAQLVEQIKDEFDTVIWLSVNESPTLKVLQANLIDFLQNLQDIELSISHSKKNRIFEYLRIYRCLVILDDFQVLYAAGQLAGYYQPEYEDYGTFLKQLSEFSHNSCFVPLSREQPREIAALEGECQPVRTLALQGLETEAAQQFFQDKGLTEEKKWAELIQLYRGYPLGLKIVTTMIHDLLDKKVSALLSNEPLFLGDLEAILQLTFEQLSELEKQVILWLAQENTSVSLGKKPEFLQVSYSEFLKIMQSLDRRCLLEKVRQSQQNLFNLLPVLKAYILLITQ